MTSEASGSTALPANTAASHTPVEHGASMHAGQPPLEEGEVLATALTPPLSEGAVSGQSQGKRRARSREDATADRLGAGSAADQSGEMTRNEGESRVDGRACRPSKLRRTDADPDACTVDACSNVNTGSHSSDENNENDKNDSGGGADGYGRDRPRQQQQQHTPSESTRRPDHRQQDRAPPSSSTAVSARRHDVRARSSSRSRHSHHHHHSSSSRHQQQRSHRGHRSSHRRSRSRDYDRSRRGEEQPRSRDRGRDDYARHDRYHDREDGAARRARTTTRADERDGSRHGYGGRHTRNDDDYAASHRVRDSEEQPGHPSAVVDEKAGHAASMDAQPVESIIIQDPDDIEMSEEQLIEERR
ncbi:hypothetical protein SYNPS1DRAFT_27415, partial [Syncephalis pseudoplumigaleata]